MCAWHPCSVDTSFIAWRMKPFSGVVEMTLYGKISSAC